jgi:hypothetical protein
MAIHLARHIFIRFRPGVESLCIVGFFGGQLLGLPEHCERRTEPDLTSW